MDARVAEKVFGRKLRWVDEGEGLDEYLTFDSTGERDWVTNRWVDFEQNTVIPEYSSRIADAMLVQAEIERRGFWMRLQSPFAVGGQWNAGFNPGCTVPGQHDNSEYCALGDTPALAICRAALQAMTGILSTEK